MLSLKRKMHIFFFLTKENYKSGCSCWLTQMFLPLCRCAVLVGMGSFTLLQSPTFETELWKSWQLSIKGLQLASQKKDATLASSHLITNQDKLLSLFSPPSLFCNPSKTSYLPRITVAHCYDQACTDLFAHVLCSNGQSKGNLCRIREEQARGRKKTRERWCPITQGNLSLWKEEALFNCEAVKPEFQVRLSFK